MSTPEIEILERLARIETTLDTIDVRTAALYDNGRPGLMTRVDRLEQVEKRRTWTIRALVAALIAVTLDLVARMLHR